MNDPHPSASLDQALLDLHREALSEPVPDSLQAAAGRLAVAHAHHQRSRHWLHWGGVAASVLVAFVIGWFGNQQWRSLPNARIDPAMQAHHFAQAATVAHAVYSPEVRHPVEVSAEQQEHLVQWLSKRLNRPLRVPHLEAEGYRLMGGRLLPGDQGSRAQFMYENATGERITLYVGALKDAAAQESSFQLFDDAGTRSFYWVNDGFGYALSGRVERPALLRLAEQVYRQL